MKAPATDARCDVRASRSPVSVLAVAFLGALACGGAAADVTVVPRPTGPALSIVAGGALTDTVGALPLQALKVNATVDGKPASNIVIHFAAPLAADGNPHDLNAYSVQFAPLLGSAFDSVINVTTDGDGNATVRIRFGHVAATRAVLVTAPSLSLSATSSYTVLPGAATRVRMSVTDSQVYVGSGYRLGATVADQWGNSRTDAITYAYPHGVVAIRNDSVIGVGFGRANIAMTAGAVRDSTLVSIIPHGILLGQVDSNIVTFELDGSSFTTNAEARQFNWLTPQASWGPLHSVLAVDARGAGSSFTLIDSTGGLRHIPNPSGMTRVGQGRFTPDGQWIYFSGNRTGFTGWDVWRMHPDGSGAEVIRQGESNYPDAWWISVAPDGAHVVMNPYIIGSGIGTLVYSTNPVNVVAQTYNVIPATFTPASNELLGISAANAINMTALDGSNLRKFTSGRFASGVSWSSDGQWFVTGTVSGYTKLLLVNYRTAEVLPIHYSKFVGSPEWRP
ncbi:MAG: hypothetical protein ABJE47_08870 [bacterium]